MSDLDRLGVTLSFNQSPVFNQTCGQVETSTHIFFMVIYSLLFLVGLILNGFTLKVYFCSSQQQAPSSVTIYLKNLAAADFLISLCLPLRIIHFSSSSLLIRRVYCNFGASAFYLNMYASILFMGYIAANRYLKIIHPLGTHFLQTVRVAKIISVVTWVFLLATTSLYIALSLLTPEPPPASIPNTLSCDVLHSRELSVFYKITHSFSAAMFLAVLVSLVYFYYSTSRRLSLAQQRQPASSGSKKLVKARRNMLVLVSVFCVCFVPYHLVRLPYAFLRGRCSWSQAFFYMKELTVLLSVFNVCLDPLIYFIFCKAFRAQLKLKREFSTTQVPTYTENVDRRTDDRCLRTANINQKMLLRMSTKQTSML